jgi:hypothetical protein
VFPVHSKPLNPTPVNHSDLSSFPYVVQSPLFVCDKILQGVWVLSCSIHSRNKICVCSRDAVGPPSLLNGYGGSLATSKLDEVENECGCILLPIMPSGGAGIARYGLDGPGIESRWGGEIFRTRPDRPWSPLSLQYDGYRVFPGGKAAGAWC